MVAGAADGWLYAVDARTGEPVWKFHLSVRSVNSPPLIKGHVVYAAHSEENVDTPGLMGRVNSSAEFLRSMARLSGVLVAGVAV